MNTLLVLAILAFAIIVLTAWILILELRIRKFFNGKNAASLEQIIMQNTKTLELQEVEQKMIRTTLASLDERLKKKIHGAKTLRFNPFAGTGSGGNQSFATALLDEEGSGVVISSLYSREKISIFAKPIKKHSSEFELSAEEQAVLK